MTPEILSPQSYLDALPADRKAAMTKLRQTVKDHLPDGFQESIQHGLLNYSVPHSLYPAGYHVNPKQPLPFLSIASQKNFIAVYHMGLYSNPGLLRWFQEEFPKHCNTKLDMGKSCIRFKKVEEIPYTLLGELLEKMTPAEWIRCYEAVLETLKKR